MRELLPRWDEIPKEFQSCNAHDPYTKLASRWFYQGVSKSELVFRDDIDDDTAIRHLSSILRSFDPKHEHKMSGVAYLMSLWMKPIG